MRYIRGLVDATPLLKSMMVRETTETLELSNRCIIEIMTATNRSIRGYTVGAAILDEIAFWHYEGANPDREVLAAIRPSLATLDGKLIALSSPYARRGVLFDNYRRYFQQPVTDVLVAQAETRLMNPSLPQRVIDDAYESDPASAAAEYGALFRTDIESYITREAVEAVTIPDRLELPPMRARYRYRAFVDPSGGMGDAFTLAIGHTEKTMTVVDCLRSFKPPFSPESVVAEICDTLKLYGVRQVTGDNYAGEWPKEQFSKRGVNYKRCEKPRSDLYRDLLPVINSGKIELPDDRRLMQELVNLERRTSRGGKDRIDHAPGQHDDLANAVAGLSDLLSGNKFDARCIVPGIRCTM